MKNITKEELDSILNKHKMWLLNDPEGERADLRGADLSGANLRKSYLCGAKLSGADLGGADLTGAYLSGAYLNGANLTGAYLSGADLSGADLSGADLSGADLSGADLTGAYLSGAYLSGAKFYWPLACPEKDSFIGYKKCRDDLIVELEIPEDALRSSATTRKCRCSKAKVLSIANLYGSETNVEYAVSKHDSEFLYKLGEVVSVDNFDTNRWNECSTGIHFFMTREEAVYY